MDDLISRQAAIDALAKGNWGVEWDKALAEAIIKNVPPAQSETHEKRTETRACDLIDRQAALDALGEEPEVWTGRDEYAQGLNNQWHYDVNALKALPSAQPECKQECMPMYANVCDTISRQDAIEEIIRRLGIKDESYLTAQEKAVVQVLKDMPPAQPYTEAEIQKMQDLEQAQFDTMYRLGYEEGKKAAQPEQRWIPVTERLPERGKDVLVTRDYDGRADHIKSCRYVEVASCYGEDDDVSWNSYSDEYKMTPKNHRVVAWMPLSEPYRREQG